MRKPSIGQAAAVVSVPAAMSLQHGCDTAATRPRHGRNTAATPLQHSGSTDVAGPSLRVGIRGAAPPCAVAARPPPGQRAGR